MTRKDKLDFHITITGKAEGEVIDREARARVRKLLKELKGVGVEIQSAYLSSGHTLGGSVNLATENEAKTDGDKE